MRGGLALDRAARYTSADFPTSGAEGAQQCERGAPMARQFIYHMQGLSKTYPGNRKILEDINLSFYPDAKIGVLGVNGSGKSTLLRIMAGIDTEFAGEAWAAEGARVGYLEQEPQLDADEIEAKGLWDLDSKIDQAMDALRCPPDDADVSKLSGGERRRVALCRLLLE